MKIVMNVLVACEESQEVTKAFRALGHRAFSCDLKPCSGGHPEWHIQGDVLEVLETLTRHSDLDLLIAHPPCTYLTNVATRWFSLRCTPPEKVVDRWDKRAQAAIFFMRLMDANVPCVAVENPTGYMNRAYRKPDQVIQPWQFSTGPRDAQNYVTKRTCLWLKGLKPLVPTYSGPKPNNAELFGRYPSGKARTWEECVSGDRATNRSKTFPGIARAMAEQWRNLYTVEP